MHDIYTLRHRKFARSVDVVVYLASEQEAETLVALAHEHNVVLIPYGGGTNVTNSL